MPHLDAGRYLFQSFSAGNDLRIVIHLNPGDSLDVLLEGDASFADATTVQVIGGGSFDAIHWQTGSSWSMGNQSDRLGTILALAPTEEAPRASINIGNGDYIKGAPSTSGLRQTKRKVRPPFVPYVIS